MNNSEVVTTGYARRSQSAMLPTTRTTSCSLALTAAPGETQYRSDTIILAEIDPNQKVAALLSIATPWSRGRVPMKIDGVTPMTSAAEWSDK